MLKIGNDHFEATHLQPKVEVCDRRYAFDAQPPSNSTNPLVFDPTGRCPAFVGNPKIARAALVKQRADEIEYAQLVKDNVPVAPIYSGLDGGMNKVFLARFPGTIISLAIVLPPGSGSELPQFQPSPGQTTTVHWRINFLAPCWDQIQPHRGTSPRPIQQCADAPRIRDNRIEYGADTKARVSRLRPMRQNLSTVKRVG